MPKIKTVFVCQNCGYTVPKWQGQCPDCGEWNTFAESAEVRDKKKRTVLSNVHSEPISLPQIRADEFTRLRVPIEEFNRVLGGGIVPGSVALIGGDPGIGKSTLLLQVSSLVCQNGRVLYVSGEESAQQIKIRAQRLGIGNENLLVLCETDLEHILNHIERTHPTMVVVDSIQSVQLLELTSSAGSVTQVRECATALQRLAKAQNIPTFIVGHVTKTGTIAGPRVLEHIVDVVLYLEGERFHTYRLLRGVKNRFGSTDEVGVFEMQNEGLVEVSNPSAAFLAERSLAAAGCTVAVTVEGTRPLLVEIQALASPTSFSMPRRTPNGIDMNRLLLLTAVLTKRVSMNLSNQDLFVNVVGGMRISEPAADLAVAVAIASSYRDIPVPHDLAIFGEVGLSGELRSIGQPQKRLNEAAKLGFKRCLVPRAITHGELNVSGIEVVGVRSLREALTVALVK